MTPSDVSYSRTSPMSGTACSSGTSEKPVTVPTLLPAISAKLLYYVLTF
jgi:hypothetical protein